MDMGHCDTGTCELNEGYKQTMLAYIKLLNGGNLGDGGEVDNSLPHPPYRPANPIVLPELPGVYPPPGMPNLPVNIPVDPGYGVGNPITIGESPEHPIALPPGIYPPLPSQPDPSPDKIVILVWVIGVGYRWVVVDTGVSVNPTPPRPTPKQG